MGSGRRIVKHTGILMFMELGIRVLDALVSIILARYLAPEGFGLLAFALSFPSLFSILPGFGMGSLITRDMARDPRDLGRYLVNGLLAKAFLAALTMAVIWAVVVALRMPPGKIFLVMLGSLLMLFETNIRFTLSFFQAAQRMGTVAVVNLAVRAAWVVLSLLVVVLGGWIGELLTVRILIHAVGLVVAVALVHYRLERARWAFDLSFTGRMLKASVPFALFRLFGTVYTDLDTVMLSALRGDVMTGFYAASNKVLRLFTFIPSSFFGAVLPALSRFSRESHDDLVRTMQRSLKYLLILSLPIAGGICMTAPQLVSLLYGPSYGGAVPALRILIWTLVFTFLNSVVTASIAAVGREKRGSAVLFLGVLVSGLSNLIVVPRFGHLGAAATTVLAEGIVFVLQIRLLKRTLPDLKVWRQTVGPVVATAALMLAAWAVRWMPFAAVVGVAGVVYLGVLVALRDVGRAEWSFLRDLVRRKPLPVRARTWRRPTCGSGITVHCRVRNEERFVRAALSSVLPLADRVLVYDTGSEDATLAKIAAIRSPKIEIVEKPSSDARGIMEYRNEMIESTDTEWFLLVDGDELYPAAVIARILEELGEVPDDVHRIVFHRRHFLSGFDFVSPLDTVGRLFRTRAIRWRLYDDADNRVGHETSYLPGGPAVSPKTYSAVFPKDIFFFHCHHLARSPHDGDMGAMRRWRAPKLPALPYFGPWPEVLDVGKVERHFSLRAVRQCLSLNAELLRHASLQASEKILERVRDHAAVS